MIYPTFRCRGESDVAAVEHEVPLDEFKEGYYTWLLRHAGLGMPGYSHDGHTYETLMRALIEKPCNFVLPMDYNRRDCMEYRREYTLLTGFRYPGEREFDDGYEWAPSVFELLMGLGAIAAYTGAGDMVESDWFWEFLHNIGLDTAWDGSGATKRDVFEKVDFWLERKYDECGNGTIFPIPADVVSPHFQWDEMLYQLFEYLKVNYPMGLDGPI